MSRIFLSVLLISTIAGSLAAEPADNVDSLRAAVFELDASPPLGSPLAYDPNVEVESPLSCRGLVLLGAGEPIVLCAVDWIGIGNDSHRAFRETLAKAAGTSVGRVAVHTLHQHDAPWCDFSIDALLAEHGVSYRPFDSPFARELLERLPAAVTKAIEQTQPVTHVGLSSATVEKVASNRRILGTDGKVAHVRYTATKDAKLREFPEGTIDPLLRMVSLWNGERPVAVLTYYATHPQSYYRTAKANPDFPGMARNARQAATGVPHVHFNGAGGNIGAGKYNDGSPENRQILADRVADAMERAWKSIQKSPIAAKDVDWKTIAVRLPAAPHLDEKTLQSTLEDRNLEPHARFKAAHKLAWLKRCLAGETIDLASLTLGSACVLHMPGELFVEYQLAAQRLRPDRFVAMAAYGDYGPAYIGTEISYAQGGYETQPNSSFVAPDVENVLLRGIANLLEVEAEQVRPLQ